MSHSNGGGGGWGVACSCCARVAPAVGVVCTLSCAYLPLPPLVFLPWFAPLGLQGPSLWPLWLFWVARLLDLPMWWVLTMLVVAVHILSARVRTVVELVWALPGLGVAWLVLGLGGWVGCVMS
jgi:hypothetical protein